MCSVTGTKPPSCLYLPRKTAITNNTQRDTKEEKKRDGEGWKDRRGKSQMERN